MSTLSMLKLGSRNNCTTMHSNHAENLKRESVFCLVLHKKPTIRKAWTVAYADGNTTAEFIRFSYLGLYRQFSDLICTDSAMNSRAFSYDT